MTLLSLISINIKQNHLSLWNLALSWWTENLTKYNKMFNCTFLVIMLHVLAENFATCSVICILLTHQIQGPSHNVFYATDCEWSQWIFLTSKRALAFAQNKVSRAFCKHERRQKRDEQGRPGGDVVSTTFIYFSELCRCGWSIKWPPLVKLVHVAQYNAWEWCLCAASGMEWNGTSCCWLDGWGRRI